MTAPRTWTCLTIVLVVTTLAGARVASLPEPRTAIATASDGANVTKPAVGQINKLIDDYTHHRASIATALSGCR